MAEAVGLASGVLALATIATKSAATLFELVKSFQHHQSRVRELLDELVSLQGILASLTETIRNIPDVDFSALAFPLERCNSAIADFERELLKCSAHAGKSFRDWAKLRYMGEDLDGFRRLLATYKATISIALTDATLKKSSATAENVKDYNSLIDAARADLEERLEGMDDKLERILGKDVTMSEKDSQEVEMIKQERLSTEKCLQICADLSDHIAQIELTARLTSVSAAPAAMDTTPNRITSGGLKECRESLAYTAKKLQGYEKALFAKLLDRSTPVIVSDENRADLARLRDEWEATRQSIEICDRASEHLKDSVSTIDNYAIGDAVQFMVSTNGKTIHGTNRGLGWKTRQVGGYVGEEALKEIARGLTGLATHVQGQNDSPQQSDTSTTAGKQREPEPSPEFTTQYGKGFTLTPEK